MVWDKFLLASAAALLFASAAEAAVVRYEVDLTPANRTDATGAPTPGGGQASVMHFKISDDFSTPLTATAGHYNDDAANIELDLGPNGLGVIHDSIDGQVCILWWCSDVGDDAQLDSYGADEYIEFTIAIPDFEFRLIEATFTQVGADDHFRLVVFSDGTAELDVSHLIYDQDPPILFGLGGLGCLEPIDNGVCRFSFLDPDGPYDFMQLTGDAFRFSVPGGTNDDYRISQVVWEVDVPEPATLGVLGVALAGLGLARRRKV